MLMQIQIKTHFINDPVNIFLSKLIDLSILRTFDVDAPKTRGRNLFDIFRFAIMKCKVMNQYCLNGSP